jgi:hypothetical protein
LTETQWLWLQCQALLDEGVQACDGCDALGAGTYCTACGKRLQPEGRLCPACHVEGVGAFCQSCGSPLDSMLGEAIETGRFDWDDWARRLAPFLGGLTPREQQLLMQG